MLKEIFQDAGIIFGNDGLAQLRAQRIHQQQNVQMLKETNKRMDEKDDAIRLAYISDLQKKLENISLQGEDDPTETKK